VIYDLLESSSGHLELREDPDQGITVAGLKRIQVNFIICALFLDSIVRQSMWNNVPLLLMGCNEQHHIITQHLYSTVALIHKLANLLILCSLEPSETPVWVAAVLEPTVFCRLRYNSWFFQGSMNLLMMSLNLGSLVPLTCCALMTTGVLC
jgi:hypothetical protein